MFYPRKQMEENKVSKDETAARISYEVLASAEVYKILAKEIWMCLRGHRVRRDKTRVQIDYDLGAWKTILDEKKWLRCGSVQEYVVPPDQQVRIAKIQNRLVRIRTCDYYTYRLHILQEIMKQYAGHEREIVELGAGCGHNILSLALTNTWDHLAGFDVAENGIQAAREAAQYFNIRNVDFDRLDLTNGKDANFKKIRGKTVFTYYCLEQLKYSTSTVIRNLILAGVKRVIHMEPTTELLRMWLPMDIVNYCYITRLDYQNNLLTSLRRVEKEGGIRIIDLKRLYYAPSYKNDPTLVCWEPST
jgi:SAM-dependent methyltransferase